MLAPFSAHGSPGGHLAHPRWLVWPPPHHPRLCVSPYAPSPCPSHYAERLAPTSAPSPSSSRFLGDPAGPCLPWSVRRDPFGACPTQCGRLLGEPHAAQVFFTECPGLCAFPAERRGLGSGPTHLGFGNPILPIDSLAARPLGRAGSSAPYISAMLLSPRSFRVEVRLCFTHFGSSGVALSRL